MKVYQAHAPGASVTAATPRAAALAFFEQHPHRRKCSILEGHKDGLFFCVRYSRDDWPRSWSDVTKNGAQGLPDWAQP